MKKVSIRFFNDREIRAVWDDAAAKWRFSVLDVVGALNGEPDYEKTRNYWKYLKAKLKREGNELGSVTTQLKFAAPDGKMRLANVMDANQIVALAKAIPNNKSAAFLDWFLYSDTTIDAKSKQKAYSHRTDAGEDLFTDCRQVCGNERGASVPRRQRTLHAHLA